MLESPVCSILSETRQVSEVSFGNESRTFVALAELCAAVSGRRIRPCFC